MTTMDMRTNAVRLLREWDSTGKRERANADNPRPKAGVRRLSMMRALPYLVAFALALCAVAVPAQTAAVPPQAPAPPPEPSFPKLFSSYTGLNGYEDLVVASDLIAGNEALETADKPDATLKQMRAALEDAKVDRALALVRSALDKPVQSPRDPDKYDELTLLPEYPGFRILARAIRIQEHVALADGQIARAIDIMRDGLRLGYIVQSETLLSGLIGVAIDTIVMERLAAHFDQLALRDCLHLIGVAQEWLKLSNRTDIVLASEHHFLHNMLAAWKSDPQRLQSIVKMMEPKDAPQSEEDFAALELSDFIRTDNAGIPALLDQTADISDVEDRAMILEARKPVWQRKPLDGFVKRATMASRLYAIVSPAYGKALSRFDEERARIHLLGVHGAIRRFQWENNRLPGSLDELKMPSLTTDPFTGKPLTYKASGNKYELSSSGSSGPITLPAQPR